MHQCKHTIILLEFNVWKQISNVTYDSSELFTDVSKIKIKYSELMNWLNIPYSSHRECFLKKLKHQKTGKKLYVSLKTKSTKEIEECLQPQTLIKLMQKVTKEIRLKLKATVTDFTGSFANELSLPSELMVFLNFLLFGNSCEDFGFSLPVKAIAQIILYNIKS